MRRWNRLSPGIRIRSAVEVMMDVALFWSLFVILGIIYFAIAMASSRNLATDEEFFYGHRKFGVLAISLSLTAVQIGGGAVLGSFEEAYRYGFYGAFYSIGVALSLLVLGLGLAYRFKRANLKTTAQIFSIKYRSLVLRRIASLMSIITLGGILMGQIIASRKLLALLIGSYQWIAVIFWLLVIAYTMFGGLRAVIATEIFQIVVVVVFCGMAGCYFSLSQSSFHLSSPLLTLFTHHEIFARPSFNHYLTLSLMPFFYLLFAQDVGQRLFASRTPMVASLSALLASVMVLLISVIPLSFGIQARYLGLTSEHGGDAIFKLLVNNSDPFFYYLLICAIIAAISSTADAALCAIGSNVVEDFVLTHKKYGREPHLGIVASRLVILGVGLISLIFAYRLDDIFGVLSVSYEISISCLLIPLIFALLVKEPRFMAAVMAMSCGAAGFIIFRIIPLPWPKELSSLMLSFAGYLVGHFYIKQPRKKAS